MDEYTDYDSDPSDDPTEYEKHGFGSNKAQKKPNLLSVLTVQNMKTMILIKKEKISCINSCMYTFIYVIKI